MADSTEDRLVSEAGAMIAARRNTANECRGLMLRAMEATTEMTAIVNRVATMQPADIIMDPAGTLATLRLVAAHALTSASGSMQIAKHAATAFDGWADDGEKLAARQIAAIVSATKAEAAPVSLPSKPSAGPMLVVDNPSQMGASA